MEKYDPKEIFALARAQKLGKEVRAAKAAKDQKDQKEKQGK